MAKCGACGRRHETAEAVRACYQEKAWQAAMNGDAEETLAIQAKEREEDVRAYTAKMERDDLLAREVARKEAEEIVAEAGSGTASVREMMEELDAIAKSHGIVWSGAERAAYETAVRTRYAKPGTKAGTGIVRHVSPAQVRKIKGLMGERDLTTLVRLPGSEDIEHMSLKGARDFIDRLLGLPLLPEGQRQPIFATDGQKRYVASLAARKGIPLPTGWESKMTFAEAKTAIDGMLKMVDAPREARKDQPATPAETTVPEGSYAIEVDGVVKFYRVDRPTEGRWAGYVFLSAQASDDGYAIKNRETKAAILALIAKDAEEAMKRYGRELGECGHCHRTLTSEWRKVGIGPICSQKVFQAA